MAEATEADFRLMLGGLSGITSDTIDLYLSDAKTKVIKHGVGITNDDFAQLQRYQAAHLMSAAGVGGGVAPGPIEMERVEDVSIKYGSSGGSSLGSLYSTNWEREYQKLLNQVLGLLSRCL